MIDVYALATPNSVKVPIALEEMGLDYTLHSVDIRHGRQKEPTFLALNPNGKVPVLIDRAADGGSLMLSESAAILIYLAGRRVGSCPSQGRSAPGCSSSFSFTARPWDLPSGMRASSRSSPRS